MIERRTTQRRVQDIPPAHDQVVDRREYVRRDEDTPKAIWERIQRLRSPAYRSPRDLMEIADALKHAPPR